MYPGQDKQQDTIGALLARLIEDGRAVAKAELAMFRTDFYRRIGRARTGALLLLLGAIMGQAAAVTFLVTLSFVLTPWIGRLGGSLVSVTLGVVAAVALIRIGVRKLVLVVEDPEDDNDEYGEMRKANSPIDDLFDRVRKRSRDARAQLTETLGETQARLHPQALITDLVDELVDQGQSLAHRAIDAVRRRPGKVGTGLVIVILLIVRPPIGRIARRIGRATRQAAASFNGKTAGGSAIATDEDETA